MKIDLRLSDEPVRVTIDKDNLPTSLRGHRVCITGKIPGYTRRQFTGELHRKFMTNDQSTVTCLTDILIVGTDPGADKLAKAKSYGVKIIEFPKFRDKYLK